MVGKWQASEARHRFPEMLEAAANGEPQYVRRRDGMEVVVVSRAYFEQTIPTLKTYLLTSGVSDQSEDAFDRAMDAIRAEGSQFILPGTPDLSK